DPRPGTGTRPRPDLLRATAGTPHPRNLRPTEALAPVVLAGRPPLPHRRPPPPPPQRALQRGRLHRGRALRTRRPVRGQRPAGALPRRPACPPGTGPARHHAGPGGRLTGRPAGRAHPSHLPITFPGPASRGARAGPVRGRGAVAGPGANRPKILSVVKKPLVWSVTIDERDVGERRLR